MMSTSSAEHNVVRRAYTSTEVYNAFVTLCSERGIENPPLSHAQLGQILQSSFLSYALVQELTVRGSSERQYRFLYSPTDFCAAFQDGEHTWMHERLVKAAETRERVVQIHAAL
jgi:hypothetical protein